MRTGLSSCGKEINEELFKSYAAAGIEVMEISVNLTECLNFDFEGTAALAKKYGIELWSFHLPFMPFSDIDISSPKICEKTLDCLKMLIDKGSAVGIKRFIVHPSGEPIISAEKRGIRMQTSKQSLKILAQYADERGAVIAVEDLPRTCLGRNSDEILELISADDRLGVCFDTNHLLSEKITDFIKRAGGRIITTHVSDYDFIDEKHWLPGEGKINWQELYKALCETGYDAVWLYELGFKSPSTLERERDLNCFDFSENAKKIFNGEL